MDADDVRLRNLTYAALVEQGRAPTPAEVADRAGAGVDPTAVIDGWRRLDDAHALVVDTDDPTWLRMLHPFSAVETPHRVDTGGREWFANCGWDAFGIPAALHAGARIESTCPDCDGGLTFEVRAGELVEVDPVAVFHCLVPASQWWDDIAFT